MPANVYWILKREQLNALASPVRHDIVDRLKIRFADLTRDDLARPATGPKLPGAKTLADQLSFLAFHETYHVGQMGYIRKSLGRHRRASP